MSRRYFASTCGPCMPFALSRRQLLSTGALLALGLTPDER